MLYSRSLLIIRFNYEAEARSQCTVVKALCFSHSSCLQCYVATKNLCVLAAQLCPTLCDPMDCSPPGSSAHGILQARILEWVAISFSRESSWPRNGTQVSCIIGRFFMVGATREAHFSYKRCIHVNPELPNYPFPRPSLLATRRLERTFSWSHSLRGHLHTDFS